MIRIPDLALILKRNARHVLFILLAVSLVAGGAGCASSKKLNEPFPEPDIKDPLVLGQGDVLEIRFPQLPDATVPQTSEQPIRPDGRISLPLAGDVQAAGLTPEQLRDSLVEKYKTLVREPMIAVIVKSVQAAHVYVGGEVKKAGLIPLTGRLSVLEAIIAAGGFSNQSANVKRVYVIRYKDGQAYSKEMRLATDLAERLDDPFFLAPQDIVFVPRTRIDRVNQWVDQYIRRMIPLPVSTVTTGM